MARNPRKPLRLCTKHWSPSELAERKRKQNAEKQARFRARMTKEQRRERKALEDARLFNWERLLPHIDKQPDGCWQWTGSFAVVKGRVRPVVRAGVLGMQPADFVVCCLSRGRPPPRCFVSSVCETLGVACVAPDHLRWSNQAVEAAKRRRQDHEQKGMVGRVE